MSAVLAFLGTRRKALAYILAAAAQLVAEAVPQTNSQNALLLHSVLAVLGLFMVHGTPNDPQPDSVHQFIEDLVHGDGPQHAAPSAIPAAAGSLQG